MTKLARNTNTNINLTRSANELVLMGNASKARRKVIRLCNRIAAKIRSEGNKPELSWKPVLERTHRPVRDYARIYGNRH